ncbi:hypothetical protein [Fulvimarina sp. MAC8]
MSQLKPTASVARLSCANDESDNRYSAKSLELGPLAEINVAGNGAAGEI